MIARRTLPLALALSLGLVACGTGAGGDTTVAADTLTRRQKDSILSTMPIPGARGIGTALDASDAAAERARRFDSLAGGS